MNFCSACGAATTSKIPNGDNRLRAVCTACGTIHYENPKIIAGTLAYTGDQVLLAKRAIEPRYGLWTLPAGFMECLETAEQAARRETKEEACAEVTIERLLLVASIPQISQVYMLYQGRLLSEHAAGEESLETGLFTYAEIPWNDLAFPVMREALEHFYADQKTGQTDITHHSVVKRRQ